MQSTTPSTPTVTAKPEQSDNWLSASIENEDLEEFLKRLKTATNHYQVLELPATAKTSEIKDTYYAMARRYHPDRFHLKSGTKSHAEISSAFARVTQAYETLTNPNARAGYDHTLERIDLLLRTGMVDAAGLALGLEAQSRDGSTLGRALADLGLAQEAAIAAALAAALHLEYVDTEPGEAGESIASLLPVTFCRKHDVAPLGVAGNVLRMAITDPMDYSVLQDAEFRSGKKVVAVVVTTGWLEAFLRRLYPEPERAATYDMLATVKPVGEVESAPTGNTSWSTRRRSPRTSGCRRSSSSSTSS